jgi:hypothetical protein
VAGLYCPVSFPGCNELMHTLYWVPHQMPMHYALIYKMNKNKTVLMTLESWRTVDRRLFDGGD